MRRAPILALGVSLGVHALVLMAVLWLPRPTPLAVTPSHAVSSRAPSIVGFEVVAQPTAPSCSQGGTSVDVSVSAPLAPVAPPKIKKRAVQRPAPRRMKPPRKAAPEASPPPFPLRSVASEPSPERAPNASKTSEAAVAHVGKTADLAAGDSLSSEEVATRASGGDAATDAPVAVEGDAPVPDLSATTSMNAVNSADSATAGPSASTAAAFKSGQSQSVGAEVLRAITDRLADAASVCYPRAAQRRGHEGVAQMRFCLDENGAPHQIALVHSSGRPQLDAAARCAIERAAPFPPLPGQCLTVPIRFALRRR